MMGGHRILIIEDEPDLLRGLEMNLTAEGFEVSSASRGDTGVEQALRERPELILLDIMLPGMNGLDVCRELRRRGFEAPIIMLTAKAEEVDRVVGLEIGADDYVTKPFGIRELLARIRVRLRRHAPAPAASAGNCDLETWRWTLKNRKPHGRRASGVDRKGVGGAASAVSRFAARSLRATDCSKRCGAMKRIRPRARWTIHILRLRQKLEEDPGNLRHILSVYGEGYKFVG
jgi:DNA-binding response OmpR family regulator